MQIQLKRNHLIEPCPVGFSWTLFFLSAIVPMSRGDARGVLFVSLIDLIFGGITLIGLSSGHFLPALVFALAVWSLLAWRYNHMYIHHYLAEGFTPANEESRDYLVKHGYYIED